MRLYILGLCILIALLATVEAKRGKKNWRHKKQKHLSKLGKGLKDGGEYLNNVKADKGFIHKPLRPGGDFHERKLNRKMKDKYYRKKKHGMKKHLKKTSWLDIKSGTDCNIKCGPEEVCVVGPINKKAICIYKKDLKKSVKHFHRFHKKETKSWRKLSKKNHKKGLKWLKKQEKLERKVNADIVSLKKQYLEENGYDKHLKNGDFEEYMKKNDFKDSMTRLEFKNPVKENDFKHSDKSDFKDSMKEDTFKNSMKENKFRDIEGDHDFKDSMKKEGDEKVETRPAVKLDSSSKSSAGECSASEFVQMRTRLMGWFHLLHGQDHLARKAHGGNIGKFYKHVSVKKELREHDGVKCGCLKSAMWQFHQLDKSGDDHLTPDELSVVEENNLEPCTKPYLTSCDRSGDGKLSSDEWCCCFSHVEAPCFRAVDEIKKAADKEVYIPRCDKEGYYMREQCRSDVNDALLCWCVDINGNELKGTATSGRAHCSKLAMLDLKKTPFF